MSENLARPIELAVACGTIQAMWINGRASWSGNYYPQKDEVAELLEFTSGTMNTIDAFRKAELSEPTIELIETGIVEPEYYSKHLPSVLGTHMLRVTAWLVPYVHPNPVELDPYYMHPIKALRPREITQPEYEKRLVENALSAGGQAIRSAFGLSMTYGLRWPRT